MAPNGGSVKDPAIVNRAYLTAILLALNAGRASAAIEPVRLDCNESTMAAAFSLPFDRPALRFQIEGDATWLEVEEDGQQLTIPDAISIPQPLRYGWHWVKVQRGSTVSVSRKESLSHAVANIKATLHCSPASNILSKIEWAGKAAELGKLIDTPADKGTLVDRLKEIRKLGEYAREPAERAIALHFYAEALASNSRSDDAAEAFHTSELAWSKMNDDRRALAAHLGRVEELRLTSAYQQVLELTPDFARLHHAQSYFVARLVNDRCLSFQAMGQLQQAQRCFDWLLDEYKVQREDAEYIIAVQNQASLLRDLGNLEVAEKLGLKGIVMSTGSDASMQRGRLHLMLADITLRRGQIGSSLAHAKAAANEFEQSKFGAPRWQANTLLLIASLYSDLGAYGEAYGVLGDAVKLLAPLGAPSRMAYAMNVFADLETGTHNYMSALLWRLAAEQTYARLGELASQESTQAKRLELQARMGEFSAITLVLSHPAAAFPLSAGLAYRLQVELALHEHRLADALHGLNELQKTPQSLPSEIRTVQLEARLKALKGDLPEAQQSLLSGAARIRALARQVRSPVLRYVITRQLQVLRESAFEIALEQADAAGSDAKVTVAAIWPWITAEAGFAAPDSVPVSAELEERFNRAIAADLLTAPTRKQIAQSPVQRELLSLLAVPGSASDAIMDDAPRILSLVGFQQSLDPDATFLAYLDGGTRGMLLSITRETVALNRAAPPDKIRAGARTLRELLSSPESMVRDIDAESKVLSEHIFGTIPQSEPPGRLYVLDDEISNRVVWSALFWPQHTQPLVTSTSVSLTRFAGSRRTSEPGGQNGLPRNFHVVVASLADTNVPAVAPLPGATAEAEELRTLLADQRVAVKEQAQATRTSALRALHDPGAWVHVAAHGFARPQRIGYSGIWLEPEPPDTLPSFLSWLDILDKRVDADFVLLNACQLADSGNTIDGNLSFADAVARAGATRVIATAWAISDSAWALWVPEFYSALFKVHDAASALRAAQLRLRNSRAFTHPFFWAGMLAFDTLSLPAPGR